MFIYSCDLLPSMKIIALLFLSFGPSCRLYYTLSPYLLSSLLGFCDCLVPNSLVLGLDGNTSFMETLAFPSLLQLRVGFIHLQKFACLFQFQLMSLGSGLSIAHIKRLRSSYSRIRAVYLECSCHWVRSLPDLLDLSLEFVCVPESWCLLDPFCLAVQHRVPRPHSACAL